MNTAAHHANRDDLILASQGIAKSLQDTSIERLRAQIRPAAPVHSNRASSAGHPCEAFGFFSRTAWDKRAPHDYGLQSIFNEGNLHEPAILREVQEDCAANGWSLIGQQQNFQDKKIEVTGHVDALISIPREGGGFRMVALEAKTMSPHIYDSIAIDLDIKNHRKPYMQSYYGQLQLYLWLSSSEMGMWVLKNKVTGLRKYIPTVLDYDYCDEMFKRLERVNKAVAAGVVPTKIMDDTYCDDCAFRKICRGEEEREIPKLNNERLLDAILLKEEMKPAHDKFEEASEIIKDEISKSTVDDFQVGAFRITRKLNPEKAMSFVRKAYFTNKIRLAQEG